MSQPATVAEALTPTRLALPEYTFTVPEKARQWKTDPHKITLRSFTVGTELDAFEAAKVMSKVAYEILQRILIKVDDRPYDQGDGMVVDAWSPKMRSLACAAVNKISIPEDDDERGPFLASMETDVP